MRRRGLSPLPAGWLTLVVVVMGCYFVFTKANPFANPYVLRAAFTDIDEVRSGSPVRIAGIGVGKVVATEPGPSRGSSVLVMELQDKALPLHDDVRLKVRPRVFLEGNYFVDLQPGSPAAPELDDGSMVPATQTASHVPVGAFLKIFERDTREHVRTVLDELGTAQARGGAEAFNRTTRYYETAFREGARLNTAARGESGQDLSAYVDAAGDVSAALNRFPVRLQALVGNVATAAGALAREQDALGATIDELPDTLRQGYAALGRVNDALPEVRALAQRLTPVVEDAPPTLDAALPFVRELRGLIRPTELGGLARDLGQAAPPLARFARGNIDLQGETRQLASCQNNTILPTTSSTLVDERFPATGPVFQEAVKWLVGVAGGGRSFDGNQLYSRTFAPTGNYAYKVGTRVFYNTQPLRGINPAPSALPPLRSRVPCETQEAPDLRSNPIDPPAGLSAIPFMRRGQYVPEKPSGRGHK